MAAARVTVWTAVKLENCEPASYDKNDRITDIIFLFGPCKTYVFQIISSVRVAFVCHVKKIDFFFLLQRLNKIGSRVVLLYVIIR